MNLFFVCYVNLYNDNDNKTKLKQLSKERKLFVKQYNTAYENEELLGKISHKKIKTNRIVM